MHSKNEYSDGKEFKMHSKNIEYLKKQFIIYDYLFFNWVIVVIVKVLISLVIWYFCFFFEFVQGLIDLFNSLHGTSVCILLIY